MSGYPDPNYAPPDTYPSDIGTSCEKPKPYWFYKGGTFCENVTIVGNLTTGSLDVLTEPVTVAGTAYQKTLIVDMLGKAWYVLAAAAPSSAIPSPGPLATPEP